MKSPDRTINTVMGISPTPYSSLAEMANGRGSASSVVGWASSGMIVNLINTCAHLPPRSKQAKQLLYGRLIGSRCEFLQVAVADLHAVVKRDRPHPLIFAVRADIVLIDGDAVHAIGRNAGRDGVDTVGGARFHVRNHRCPRPHLRGYTFQRPQYLGLGQDGPKRRLVGSAVGNIVRAVHETDRDLRVAEDGDQLLANLLRRVPGQDAAVHVG